MLARHDRGLDPHDIAAAGVRAVATPADLAAARARIEQLRVEAPVLAYLVALVRATRDSPSLTLGVSPRGATALLHAAKAWAWLAGRDYVTPDEVKAVVKPALRHRIAAAARARARGRHAPTACSTASSPPSRSRADAAAVPIPTRRLAASWRRWPRSS